MRPGLPDLARPDFPDISAAASMYYVPSLYDMFMSEPRPDGSIGRWAAKNLLHTCQSDWFFASMLREWEPDLLGEALSGL